MWDSMESIWQTANEDKIFCNTYVIPIPYADLNHDGSVAKWHHEINLFPKNVPVLDYKKINLKKLKPDVIFFHNPYDNYNRVTSIDSNFYSANLKKLTKYLIYVPYYATTGLMSESQSYMPSYDNADYIMIQSEAMRSFFAPTIPNEKFLPFGSPKFDRAIQMCKKAPKIPEKWQEKIEGKKVYFYNTSLGGLLHDTEKFLQKMKYVFKTFDGRDDCCLLWRPHPLIDATLSSMRSEAQKNYNELKKFFIDHEIGIYDETPDIDKSIAISDVYIGDTKTSVTSLFGVAGKPTFFLNNNINRPPKENDWRGKTLMNFQPESKDWMITQGNKLYHAPNHDFNYKYYCDLSDYASGNYYKHVLEIEDKVYVFPFYAQDILIIKDKKIEKKIPLKKFANERHLNLFSEVIKIEDDIFIIPNHYPEIICYNIKTDEIKYIGGIRNFFLQPTNFDIWRKSFGVWKENLLLASPNTRAILLLNLKNYSMQRIDLPTNQPTKSGFISMIQDEENFYLMPYEEKTITCLNMKNKSIRDYANYPEGFQCYQMPRGKLSNSRPFIGAICDEEEILLIPYWANMFVRMNKKTGRMTEWKTPFEVENKIRNGYFNYIRKFILNSSQDKKEIYIENCAERQWYKFKTETKEFEKINMQFDIEELKEHANGFEKQSEWNPYGCFEGALSSLEQLLNDELPGKKFDKEIQLKAYEKFNASPNGNSGEKIYKFIKEKMS